MSPTNKSKRKINPNLSQIGPKFDRTIRIQTQGLSYRRSEPVKSRGTKEILFIIFVK